MEQQIQKEKPMEQKNTQEMQIHRYTQKLRVYLLTTPGRSALHWASGADYE